MENATLPQFVDAKRFPTVFTTEQLMRQKGLSHTIRTYAKGDAIFHQEEQHLFTYHVKKGVVRLYLTSPDGGVKTLFYHTAETQFGFQGFKRDKLTKSTAVAVTDCEIIAIPFKNLLAFCNDHTEYYLAYIEYLFAIMNSQTEEIASLSFQTGVKRLATLLYALSGNDSTTIPYSIDELAEIIGAHRNTVSNSLAYLRKKGLVGRQARPITISDAEGLKNYLEELQ